MHKCHCQPLGEPLILLHDVIELLSAVWKEVKSKLKLKTEINPHSELLATAHPFNLLKVNECHSNVYINTIYEQIKNIQFIGHQVFHNWFIL